MGVRYEGGVIHFDYPKGPVEEDDTCHCAAHCWCECACGAWDDTIDEPCSSCGANGGWDEWEDDDDSDEED